MSTQTNPFNLESFLRFCESKPAKEPYKASLVCFCALGQYVNSVGGRYDGENYVIDGRKYETCNNGPNFIGEAFGLSQRGKKTFGALAYRLRAALSKARAAG